MKTDGTNDQTPTPDELRAMLRITCADAGPLLSDYRDGVLVDDDAERIATHVSNCVACGVILDQLDTTVTILGQVASRRPLPSTAEIDRVVARATR